MTYPTHHRQDCRTEGKCLGAHTVEQAPWPGTLPRPVWCTQHTPWVSHALCWEEGAASLPLFLTVPVVGLLASDIRHHLASRSTSWHPQPAVCPARARSPARSSVVLQLACLPPGRVLNDMAYSIGKSGAAARDFPVNLSHTVNESYRCLFLLVSSIHREPVETIAETWPTFVLYPLVEAAWLAAVTQNSISGEGCWLLGHGSLQLVFSLQALLVQSKTALGTRALRRNIVCTSWYKRPRGVSCK